jgi:calcineurin-like phosphoesterase family protein
MSNRFVIGDLHLGHKKILKHQTKRAAGTGLSHDEWIIQQWNSVVQKKDLVIVLGDVVWGKESLKLLRYLKGNKHLILGNHDRLSLDLYSKYFSKIHGFMSYKKMFWLSHCPIHESELFNKINVHGHDHKVLNRGSKYCNVTVDALNGIPMSFDELRDKYIEVYGVLGV